MFKNTYQHGLLTVFCANSYSPLALWRLQVRNGHIQTVTDSEIKSQVLDITGLNVSTTFMVCPKKRQDSLGISMPYLVMIIKNMHKYFTFEVTILDETLCKRRFRVSNFQSTTKIDTFCTAMPIGLSGGWNQVHFNLAEFTRRAYNLQFHEVVRIQVNANIRIRRIYFSRNLCTEDELPAEYKLYFPVKRSIRKPLKPVQVDNIQNGKQKSKESLLKEQSMKKIESSGKLSNTPLSRASTISKGDFESMNQHKSSSTVTLRESDQSNSEMSLEMKDVVASLIKNALEKALHQSQLEIEAKHNEREDYKDKENEEDRDRNDTALELQAAEVMGISSRTSILHSELSIIREESPEQIEKEEIQQELDSREYFEYISRINIE